MLLTFCLICSFSHRNSRLSSEARELCPCTHPSWRIRFVLGLRSRSDDQQKTRRRCTGNTRSRTTTQEKRQMAFSLVLMILMTVACRAMQASQVRYYDWQIQYLTTTRLCHSKTLVSVNGEFPGPTVYANEGDIVQVNVTNLVNYNITLHWHGVRQLGTPWADGAAYVTQCPLKAGDSYVYKFNLKGHKGTLLWHAHLSWLRATVHGVIIIHPMKRFPFPRPFKEIPLLLGEWWNANVEDVLHEALLHGGGYNVSDALTINGQPGFLYECSQERAVRIKVVHGGTYLLRIVNAALNFILYFSVASHPLKVVEIDGCYTKPYTASVLVINPGQTMNVLLTADRPAGNYYIAATPYSPAPISKVPYPNIPTTALLEYHGRAPPPILPIFPAANDTNFAAEFNAGLRSLHGNVPRKVDRYLFDTVGYAYFDCPLNQTCMGPHGKRVHTAINNNTFAFPHTDSLLQAYYEGRQGIYMADFPDRPPYLYNFTGVELNNTQSEVGTKLSVLKYNSVVQLILQNTALFKEAHPFHLHGHNFYVVGSGLNNFDHEVDTPKFNLVDPPLQNTIAVPHNGWVAIRFRADNPGVWLFHCHIDIHQAWGMAMGFIVNDGRLPAYTIPNPPADLPAC